MSSIRRKMGPVAIAALVVLLVAFPLVASAFAAPAGADIRVRKTASVTTAYDGQLFTYVIVVSNIGGIKANNVKLSDILPSNVDPESEGDINFSAGGNSCWLDEIAVGDEYEDVIRCDFGSLASRATRTVAFQVRSEDSYGEGIYNTAKGTSSSPESNYGNNSSTAIVNPDAGCIAFIDPSSSTSSSLVTSTSICT